MSFLIEFVFLLVILMAATLQEPELSLIKKPDDDQTKNGKSLSTTTEVITTTQVNLQIPKCPEDFTEINNYCYKLTDKDDFLQDCPLGTPVEFRDIVKIIEDLPDDNAVWVPARKNYHNLTNYVWIEGGASYMQELVLNVSQAEDCLIFVKSGVESASCNDKYPRICMYPQIDQIQNKLCSAQDKLCAQADFRPKSKCLCIRTDSLIVSYPKFEFVNKYQLSVFRNLVQNASSNYSMGLECVNEELRWVYTQEPLKYNDFWAGGSSCVRSFAISYGGFVPIVGSAENSVQGVVYELEIPEVETTITVDVIGEEILVVLKQSENAMMLFCFTTSFAVKNPIFVDASSVLNTSYNLDLNGFGYYWCETFDYFEEILITSNYLYYCNQKFDDIFELTIVIEYNNMANYNSQLVEDIIKKVATESILVEHFQCISGQVIEINNKDKIFTLVLYLPFETFSNDLWQKIFKYIESFIEFCLELYHFKLKSMTNSNFCSAQTTESDGIVLTWPATFKETLVQSEELCFVDRFRISRKCLKDSDAKLAQWQNVENKCVLYDTSSELTSLLYEIYKNVNETALGQVEDILKRNETLDFLDLYLIAATLKEVLDENVANSDGFRNVIDLFLNVDEKVLVEAQNNAATTDLVLEVLSLLPQSYFEQNLTLQNYALIPTSASINCFYVLQNLTVYSSLNCDDTDFELRAKIQPQFAIKYFKVYFSPKFYIDISNNYSYAHNFIINYQEDPSTTPANIEITFKLKTDPDSDLVCNVWNQNFKNSKVSFWSSEKSVTNFQFPLVTCEFSTFGSFALMKSGQNVTEDLIDLIDSDASCEEIVQRLEEISQNYKDFQQTDVVLTSQVLRKVRVDFELDLEHVSNIVSNLHEIDRYTLAESQRMNSATDSVLYCIDEIVNKNKKENVMFAAKNFMISISRVNESAGVVLQNEANQLKLAILGRNESIEKYDNIVAAAVLSEELLEQVDAETKLVITFYSKDSLFNEQNQPEDVLVSPIFGVTLWNFNQEFKAPLKIYHNLSVGTQSKKCAFWKYAEANPGYWHSDSEGSLSALLECQYWHTTHFALLLLPEDPQLAYIDLITLINCSLSLFGLAAIIVTALFFRRWRVNPGNQILLNFVVVTALQIGTFYLSSAIKTGTRLKFMCSVIGIILHYTIISQFCWMLVIAILQFRRFVQVLTGHPRRLLLKSCLLGWGVPLIPVLTVYFVNANSYVNSHSGLCYPSGLGLYFGVWLPTALIVVINTVIFCCIFYNVLHKQTEYITHNNSDILLQWRLAILLFFILGLTWTFGYFVHAAPLFIYLFCFTATLQGFIMFLFFIVFNSTTRLMYLNVFKTCRNF